MMGEVYNYPGVKTERDPRAALVNSVRRLETHIRDYRIHIKAIEQDLAEKRSKIAEWEQDVARLKVALDHLSQFADEV